MVPEQSAQTSAGNRGIRRARKLTVALLATLALSGPAYAGVTVRFGASIGAQGVFTSEEVKGLGDSEINPRISLIDLRTDR